MCFEQTTSHQFQSVLQRKKRQYFRSGSEWLYVGDVCFWGAVCARIIAFFNQSIKIYLYSTFNTITMDQSALHGKNHYTSHKKYNHKILRILNSSVSWMFGEAGSLNLCWQYILSHNFFPPLVHTHTPNTFSWKDQQTYLMNFTGTDSVPTSCVSSIKNLPNGSQVSNILLVFACMGVLK